MNKSFKGMAIASAVAGLFAFSATAADTKAAPAKDGKAAAAQVKCTGINECKGKGACGGANHGCAGKNECKGKGWTMMTEADCKAKSGTVAAAEAPAAPAMAPAKAAEPAKKK
jgi:hypothetical protein